MMPATHENAVGGYRAGAERKSGTSHRLVLETERLQAPRACIDNISAQCDQALNRLKELVER
jgi:hypothetical protein